QSPPDGTLAALTEGVRIRTNGPAVRDAVGLSVRDVLQGGIMSIFIRPPAEGIVMDASPASFRFAAARGPRLIDVPWSGVDSVDVHQGPPAGVGAVQGAGLGALTGLAMWGLVELIFLAADNPVVDEPGYMIGVGAGAGALL